MSNVTKDLKISILLDFYGNMLTDKQREVVEFYYNEDLSLSEIADHSGITRQGVRDSIKRGELILLDLEERLGLYKRFSAIQQDIEQIVGLAMDIEACNARTGFSSEIHRHTREIIRLADRINS